MPVEQKISIRKKKKNVISDDTSCSKQMTDQPVKKRGRKPKGGKILDVNNKNNIENIILPNVIIHLKCSLKDLKEKNNTIQSYNNNDFGFEKIDIVYEQSINTSDASMDYKINDDVIKKELNKKLKEIIQKYTDTRFCIICNYLSKIDNLLRNEFIKVSFNKVPKEYILKFLNHIVKSEKIKFSKDNLNLIHSCFDPDIRSMINYLQQNFDNIKLNLINTKDFDSLIKLIELKNDSSKPFINKVQKILTKYSLNQSVFLQKFLIYLFEKKKHLLNNSKYIDLIDNIYENKNSYLIIDYLYFTLIEYF